MTKKQGSQIKSKERVAERGEVFTNEREVKAMCDLVAQECDRIDSRLLEPACGDGNFLAEILERKLATVKKLHKRSAYDYERYSVLAVSSIYGVDIMQENGLASSLPLCNNKLEIKRSLTTESAAILMPFVNQELIDRDGGMYYGNNAVSHNLVMLNRRNSKNGNGFILGTPGSGKSMSAKQEMLTVLHYDSEDDPIAIKSDFIVSLCETVIGHKYGLTASQHSLIDRCVRKVYEPYLDSYNEETGTYDKTLMPNLVNFYHTLRAQSGYDAVQLADSLEIYVTGSMNVFAYPTNVEYDNRFVVYDIKDIGATMKSMGLLVVLDNIWNRIISGRKQGKNVWFFIDEIYLLFKTP